MNSRLEKLHEFLKETPEDPFVIYGLALEYSKLDVKEAEKYFNRLLTDFPDYLPTYYHAGKLKETLEEWQDAIEIYKKGIKLAVIQSNQHTKSELEMVLFEVED